LRLAENAALGRVDAALTREARSQYRMDVLSIHFVSEGIVVRPSPDLIDGMIASLH
jgi:hypothetical protein